MSKLYYPAVIHEPEEGETSYWVSFPDFPGCFTQGKDIAECVEMAERALGVWFEPDPNTNEQEQFVTPSNPSSIELEKGDCVVMIKYDSIEWAKRYNSKAVKKTLSIPGWLNDLAMQKHINFSQTLQEALMRQLDV